METVAPDSWYDAGGSVGKMRELGGRLVISQTWENHQAVAKLLDELRNPPPSIPPAVAKHVWAEALQRWARDPDPTDPELALAKVLPADTRVYAPSLRAAMGELGKAAGVEILLDDNALVAAGYDPNVPLDVGRPVGGQTLAHALSSLLSAADDPPLRYTIRESSLVVTTRRQADAVALTRVYDIGDLLPPKESSSDVEARLSAAEQLGAAIRDTVDPDSWRDNGGNLGTIRYTAGFLLVTQNLRNHEGIARTLAAVRAGRPTTRPATRPDTAPAAK